jgi:hypothetical protein
MPAIDAHLADGLAGRFIRPERAIFVQVIERDGPVIIQMRFSNRYVFFFHNGLLHLRKGIGHSITVFPLYIGIIRTNLNFFDAQDVAARRDKKCHCSQALAMSRVTWRDADRGHKPAAEQRPLAIDFR